MLTKEITQITEGVGLFMWENWDQGVLSFKTIKTLKAPL